MSCGIKIDVDELLKNVKDDHVVRGEIVNGNTLRLHRKEGGMVDVVLPASEDHDTKIRSFDLANRGGKNVLEITQTDGSKFTAYLPETTPPAADKYVTAFDIATQGNTTSLTITRSDNEKFTVQLPQAQGGGTDIYVNKVEVDSRVVNGTETHPFLVITRNDGQKFEVELPSGGAGGPDVHLKTLTTDFPPREGKLPSEGDGYYFSKNVPIEATLTNNAKITAMQPWNRLYTAQFDTTDPEHAREIRPVVEVAIVKGRLKLIRDDATATYLDFPNAGGGGGAGGSDKYTRSLNAEMDVDDTRIVGDVEYRRPTLYANLSDGTNISTKLPFEVAFSKRTGDQLFPGASGAGDGAIKDVKPSTSKNRTIVVTDSKGTTKEIVLPDTWFNGKDGKDGKDGFVSVEEYNALSEKTILSSWAASSIRKSFDTASLYGGKYDYVPFGVFTTADGKPTPFQAVNQFTTIQRVVGSGSDYSIVLLNQPGDSSNSAHKHNPLPYLRSIGHEGNLRAIDVFEWRLVDDPDASSNKTLRAVYRGTVYAEDDVGNGILLYPLAGMYLPGDPNRSNYAGQMPPAFEFRIRNTNTDHDVAYDPSVVFKNSYQITPNDIRPVF